jgi:hypothetical protein
MNEPKEITKLKQIIKTVGTQLGIPQQWLNYALTYMTSYPSSTLITVYREIEQIVKS